MESASLFRVFLWSNLIFGLNLINNWCPKFAALSWKCPLCSLHLTTFLLTLSSSTLPSFYSAVKGRCRIGGLASGRLNVLPYMWSAWELLSTLPLFPLHLNGSLLHSKLEESRADASFTLGRYPFVAFSATQQPTNRLNWKSLGLKILETPSPEGCDTRVSIGVFKLSFCDWAQQTREGLVFESWLVNYNHSGVCWHGNPPVPDIVIPR